MDEKLTVTTEDLRTALEAYKLVLPAEVMEIFQTVEQVPEFGLLVALEVQSAINAAGRNQAAQGSLFDAAIRPAFLLGLLAGREQGRRMAGRAMAGPVGTAVDWLGRAGTVCPETVGTGTNRRGMDQQAGQKTCIDGR